jgi:hypothetical protein
MLDWFSLVPLAPNATLQARLEAGARHERTLEGVALQAIVRPWPVQPCPQLGQARISAAA